METVFEPPKFLEARPTEYAGVKFRSKSEAVVARGLDIGGWLWEYEPNRTSEVRKHWDFDFLIAGKLKPHGINLWLCEYKPSEPTETWREEYYSKAENVFNTVGIYVSLLVGSPFRPLEAAILYYFNGDDWIKLLDPVLAKHWPEAVKYRFDLQQ